MTREEAIKKWVIPAIKNTWNEKKCMEILKALEQEPCEDSISRKEAENLLKTGRASEIWILPSVQPKVKTGHWMFKDADDQACSIYTCDKCGEQITILDDTIKSPQEGRYNYCHNCGAKMV